MQLRRCLCCKKEPDFLFASSGYFGGVVITLINRDSSHSKCTRLWPILWSGNVQFQGKKILVSLGRENQLLSITPETCNKAAMRKATSETLDLYVPVICNCALLISRCLGVRSKTSDAVSWRMSNARWCPWILDQGTAVKSVRHEHLTNMFITKRS